MQPKIHYGSYPVCRHAYNPYHELRRNHRIVRFWHMAHHSGDHLDFDLQKNPEAIGCLSAIDSYPLYLESTEHGEMEGDDSPYFHR